MRQELNCQNLVDENDNPTGGWVKGVGIDIRWQDGPLGRGPDRKEPNGAFVEGVIEAAAQRLRHYQEGKFASTHNEVALTHLELALQSLDYRTRDREARDVEGTHSV
jgi:hypothetical protein